MPKPITGVYRRTRSTRWQLRIKVPSDLLSLHPTLLVPVLRVLRNSPTSTVLPCARAIASACGE